MGKSFAACLLVTTGCGHGSATESGARPEPPLEDYSSEVDGVTISYPSTWHRAEAKAPLTADTGEDVEVLGLSTAELPNAAETECVVPRTAVTAMGEGDLILVVRAAGWTGHLPLFLWHFPEPLNAKPDDLLSVEPVTPDMLQDECALDGVEQRPFSFMTHRRHYTVFLAYKGELSHQRRRELDAAWSSLTLHRLPGADGLPVEIDQPYWHVITTHCGIQGTHFDDRDWIPTSGPDGRTPSWGGGFNTGTMTLSRYASARFDTRDGENTITYRPANSTDPEIGGCL